MAASEMQEAEPEPRRVGIMWTLGPNQPVAPVQQRVAARFARLDPEAAGVLVEAGEISMADAQQRFKDGTRCYAAWVGERLAAYGWVSFGAAYVGELDLRLTLLPGEAYIWDCFTLPDFRQQGLYSALLAYMVEDLRAEGPCRIWIGADFDNQPSHKGIDRAGFLRVADAAVGPDPRERWFKVLPYPGVPEELVAAASRVFFGNEKVV